MKRYVEEQNIIHREHKRRLFMTQKSCGATAPEMNHFDLQKGRYRKKDAYDCGNPNCCLCHYDKVFKIKSQKQKKSDLSFNEQLKDS